MYEIKPILDQTKMHVDLPSSMYKVKSIYEASANSAKRPQSKSTYEGINGAVCNAKDLDALQKRQSDIVKQLEQLRLRLNSMQQQLGVNEITTVKTVEKTSQQILNKIDTKYLQDIVLHVNPINIPYSLIGLQTKWMGRLNLIVNVYTHSSVPTLPEQNKHFSTRFNVDRPTANAPTLKLTLIWKDTPTSVLVCTSGSASPILGEANIIRYLMRIGPSEFGYSINDSIQATLEIDTVLDLAHELLSNLVAKERAVVMKKLSQRLGGQQAFGGNNFNASDIAVLSALKQLNLAHKEIPSALKSWFGRSEVALGF